MKLKGVNPIEQHIEKIVLGLVFLVLLAVIAIQFVTTPNNIDDGGRSVAPAQVYTALEQQANQLQSQITDLNPTLPDVQPVDLVERYDNAFASSGGKRLTLSSALGQGVDIAAATGAEASDIEIQSSGPLAALAVPATSTPVAASQWATLDPYALLEVPQYADYVPAQQPYDFASISVEASFSGTELRNVLDGSSGGNAIPTRYWSSTGIAILGFEAERQRRLEDGTWGPAEPIQTPPHTPMPTRAVGADSGLQDLVTVVTNASREMGEVARPAFPPSIAGPRWVPPSERVDMGNSSEADQIRRIQRQLERAREDLERLTNAPSGPRTDPGTGPGKTDTRPGRRDPGSTQPNDRNRERIERTRERIKELEEQLKDLGVEEDNTTRVRTSRNDVRSVLEEESIDLWAHDLGVEPGATYRYRTRVVVNNPLFRKQAELDPDDEAQQQLARDPFARGAWSEWSDPVVAGAREYYFVTSASQGAAASTEPARTTIELYKVYYGHYRKSTLNVSPGDLLATDLRVSGNLLAFDPQVLPAEEAAEYVSSLDAAEAASQMPEGVSELASRISIEIGAFVLDVYTGQEQTEGGLGRERTNIVRVVIRDAQGNIVVHTEQGDENSLAYAQASSSASAASSTSLRAPGEQPAISPAAALFEASEP
jgi:hypothetical protein